MNFIHVVAAAIMNDQRQVFLALRPLDKHQGGLWEFPGGKVEAGEESLAALDRELHEEVGIRVRQARPLIRIQHRYPDKAVLLDVWCVTEFSGEPHGREGQEVEWVPVAELAQRSFPKANGPIVKALQLPDRYLITPEPESVPDFPETLERILAAGEIELVQLRARKMLEGDYLTLAREVCAICHRHGARMLVNGPPEWVARVGADGVHLSAARLMDCGTRPLSESLLVAASCHSDRELQHAASLGADFAVLGSVLTTASHPGVTPLGWSQARAMIERVAIPVYVLGGMSVSDRDRAFEHGAQGIAAIRGLWQE